MQRILADAENSQHAKLNMAGFALPSPTDFGLRWRMVGVCSKAPIINFPAGNVKGDVAMDREEALSSQQSEAISQIVGDLDSPT